jgi:hypothetical protein
MAAVFEGLAIGIGTRCCHISATIGNFEMKISRNLIQSTFYVFGLFSAIGPTVQRSAKNPNQNQMSNICKCRNSGNKCATKVILEPNIL